MDCKMCKNLNLHLCASFYCIGNMQRMRKKIKVMLFQQTPKPKYFTQKFRYSNFDISQMSTLLPHLLSTVKCKTTAAAASSYSSSLSFSFFCISHQIHTYQLEHKISRCVMVEKKKLLKSQNREIKFPKSCDIIMESLKFIRKLCSLN